MSLKCDVNEESRSAEFIRAAVVKFLEGVLEQVSLTNIVDDLGVEDDLHAGGVESDLTVLVVPGIPVIVKLTDELTSVALLMDHGTVRAGEEVRVLMERWVTVLIDKVRISDYSEQCS